ncbi:hypothetical protein UPYG_G00173850 [Umbra pygmaea]|uniref:Migration and invasion inhibitory protein n=1 Tax=Umbra pygmaea TaxID=75934 RepID=A0ABD0WPL0_UMBPY
MSSTERLSALRERNKQLLTQLRHQTETLLIITGTNDISHDSKQTEQNKTTKNNGQNEEKSPPEILVTLMDCDRSAARSALSKPKVLPGVQLRDRENTVKLAPPGTGGEVEFVNVTNCQTSTPSLYTRSNVKPSHSVEHTTVYAGLQDQGNSHPASVVRSIEARRPNTRPDLSSQEDESRVVGKVTFQSSGQEQMLASDRQRMRPLLGYDWIAGIVDAESSLTERSEQFFTELHTFRQVNRDECVHSKQAGISEEDVSPLPLSIEMEDSRHTMDTHHCIFCYRINSRLFPTPLDAQEACPMCRKPKSHVPHTVAEPAFIRVSIPRSTLLPAYQYKAHRRCSFDPSDSLGLPSHCLSGWSNQVLGTGPQISSLDLKSSVTTKAASSGFPSVLPQTRPQQDLSMSRVSGGRGSDQLLDVSRLVRYRFQCVPPNRKSPSPSHPVF